MEEFNRIQQEGLIEKSDYEVYLDTDNWKVTKKHWKYWVNRIRFDSIFCLSFFVIFIICWILRNLYIVGLEEYIRTAGYLMDLIYLGTVVFLLYILNRGPYELTNLINKNREIFKNIDDFNKYMGNVRSIYDSKTELYIPVIITVIFQICYLLFLAPIIAPIDEILRSPLYLTTYILYVIWSSIFILLVSSGFILFITAFIWINKLGKKEYPLNVTFANLKSGVFDNIGMFVLKISIPSSLVGTFYSILGLYMVLVLKNILGYTFIAVSMLATFIVILLLYKNTIHVHESIILFKKGLKLNLLESIDLVEKTEDLSQRYQTIYNINNYFEKIDEISDWPFDPGSIKKILLTIISSVVPFVLSLFGIV